MACCGSGKFNRKALLAKRERLQKRLDSYLDKEEQILSAQGVQSYTIGPRSASRYNVALGDIKNQIEELERQIDEIDCLLNGGTRRKAVGIIPRDI